MTRPRIEPNSALFAVVLVITLIRPSYTFVLHSALNVVYFIWLGVGEKSNLLTIFGCFASAVPYLGYFWDKKKS